MGKRKAFLHVGLPGAGDVVDTAVHRHRDRLAELDVLVPTRAREESFRAALEVRRLHKAWGYRRAEVEGAWAGICRRALKGRSTVLVSQTALAGAEPDQVELLVTQLAGLKRHVVVTVAAPGAGHVPGDPDHDLPTVLARWAAAVRDPGRVHVVLAPRGDAEEVRAEVWRRVGDVVGFGTRSLPVAGLRPASPPAPYRALPAPDTVAADRLHRRAQEWQRVLREGGYDVHGDLDDLLPPAPAPASPTGRRTEERLLLTSRALADAHRELDRLTRRNESLEARLAEVEAAPRRLRRVGVA